MFEANYTEKNFKGWLFGVTYKIDKASGTQQEHGCYFNVNQKLA